MHPMNVLRMAAAMNGPLKRILLVGCEPAELGGDEGHMGLSEAVEAALEGAIDRIEALVNQIMDEKEM
jgi:hydrogenase maturation protease